MYITQGKHVDIRYHFTREAQEHGEIQVIYPHLRHGSGFPSQSLAEGEAPELRGDIEHESLSTLD